VALLQEHLPVHRDSAEIHRFDVAVTDGDVRPWRIPHPLGGDTGRLGFDLSDQVAAKLAAGRLREHFQAAQGELAGRDQVALLLKDTCLAFDGQRRDVEVGIGADKGFQGRVAHPGCGPVCGCRLK